MVGLRWWNQVDDDGRSHWMFESRKVRLLLFCCEPDVISDYCTALFSIKK